MAYSHRIIYQKNLFIGQTGIAKISNGYFRAESYHKGKKRLRIYQINLPQDPRQQVFSYWIEQDKMRPGSSLFWEDHLNSCKPKLDDNKPDYLQLTLVFLKNQLC